MGDQDGERDRESGWDRDREYEMGTGIVNHDRLAIGKRAWGLGWGTGTGNQDGTGIGNS